MTATLILNNKAARAQAVEWVMMAPMGSVVTFRRPKRSIPQNDRLHAMLTDLATQLPWHGQKLDVDDWKLMFMDALNREVRAVPSIDGRGFVNLGRHTSKLSKDEFSDLMELIAAFAAERGIELREPV